MMWAGEASVGITIGDLQTCASASLTGEKECGELGGFGGGGALISKSWRGLRMNLGGEWMSVSLMHGSRQLLFSAFFSQKKKTNWIQFLREISAC
jgi:hypothetical protein